MLLRCQTWEGKLTFWKKLMCHYGGWQKGGVTFRQRKTRTEVKLGHGGSLLSHREIDQYMDFRLGPNTFSFEYKKLWKLKPASSTHEPNFLKFKKHSWKLRKLHETKKRGFTLKSCQLACVIRCKTLILFASDAYYETQSQTSLKTKITLHVARPHIIP